MVSNSREVGPVVANRDTVLVMLDRCIFFASEATDLVRACRVTSYFMFGSRTDE
jgi:hypothetical protein